jgi:hypothetical protein
VTGAAPSLTSLVAWAEFALCLAVPFFFSGVVVRPALGDCQHAHDPWRSTDHHQGSFGSGGRPCLRSLEFIFPHHRQPEPNGPAVDVRRLAAYAGLDHQAASAEHRRRRRHCPVPPRWRPRESRDRNVCGFVADECLSGAAEKATFKTATFPRSAGLRPTTRTVINDP